MNLISFLGGTNTFKNVVKYDGWRSVNADDLITGMQYCASGYNVPEDGSTFILTMGSGDRV